MKTFILKPYMALIALMFTLNLNASDDFLWKDGSQLGGGWKYSSWMGYLETSYYPFVYVWSEGSWLWIADQGSENDAEAFWTWDYSLGQWRFNSSSFYPWMVIWGDSPYWLKCDLQEENAMYYVYDAATWYNRDHASDYAHGEIYLDAATYTRGDKCIDVLGDIDDSDEYYYDDLDDSNDDTYQLVYDDISLSSFLIGRYEVTNAELAFIYNWGLDQGELEVVNGSVRNVQGSAYDLLDLNLSGAALSLVEGTLEVADGQESHPCAGINWFGSVIYCNLLSEYKGLDATYDLSDWSCDFNKTGYRLPTEAEWEYAARGGATDKRFPWGDTISHDDANYYSYKSSDIAYDVATSNGAHPDYAGTSPVASFPSNGYGLFDVSGNVWEWCHDLYERYNKIESTTDPVGGLLEDGAKRVLRGGSFQESAYSCRVSNRFFEPPLNAYINTGFRICRSDF